LLFWKQHEQSNFATSAEEAQIFKSVFEREYYIAIKWLKAATKTPQKQRKIKFKQSLAQERS
jgi:hypothetical protein